MYRSAMSGASLSAQSAPREQGAVTRSIGKTPETVHRHTAVILVSLGTRKSDRVVCHARDRQSNEMSCKDA
jgi:hypothetical protein